MWLQKPGDGREQKEASDPRRTKLALALTTAGDEGI
jgi:hypothetical protein